MSWKIAMRRLFIFIWAAVAACVVLTGQSKPFSIVGAWRVTEIKTTGQNGSINSNPQPGLILFTQKHYSQIRINGDKPRPNLPQDQTKATIAELLAVWGPLDANAGTYEITGANLTTRPMVAKNPSTMRPGSFRTWRFAVEGKTLTLTQVKTQSGPVTNAPTLKLTRLE